MIRSFKFAILAARCPPTHPRRVDLTPIICFSRQIVTGKTPTRHVRATGDSRGCVGGGASGLKCPFGCDFFFSDFCVSPTMTGVLEVRPRHSRARFSTLFSLLHFVPQLARQLSAFRSKYPRRQYFVCQVGLPFLPVGNLIFLRVSGAAELLLPGKHLQIDPPDRFRLKKEC
jgi:hypothetical protein